MGEKTRVGVLGATGYAGVELLRLLFSHPQVQVVAATSESYAGQTLAGVFPHFGQRGYSLRLRSTSDAVEESCAEAEVVFLCLPPGMAMSLVPDLLRLGKRVIDFGADFRLRDPACYQRWYGRTHTCPEWLGEAVYGLPEVNRSRLRTARLVANPGCYPTAVLLALAPLAGRTGVEWSVVVADCKSGVSGAGRSLSLGTHFCEVNDEVHPYSVAGHHRHVPEMEQELEDMVARQRGPGVEVGEVRVAFTPHLVPMNRGLLATVYVPVRDLPPHPAEAEPELLSLYRHRYQGEPFVQVLEEGLPSSRDVRASNLCQVAVRVERRTGLVLVAAAIDNLGKGAAGQAVQNLNIMMGWPEDSGLANIPLFP